MSYPKRKFFLFLFDHFLVTVAMIGFIGMLLATGGQVLFRYVLRIPVPWTEELARILFTQSMFIGIAIAIREKNHIVVDFLFKKLPMPVQALGRILFDIAILLLLLLLVRGTIIMTQITWNSYMIALDWVRTGYLYIGEMITVIFMMFYILLEILENIQILKMKVLKNGEGSLP
jgi:TRAP-type C4-dicarboxylate transport system permease small subunit